MLGIFSPLRIQGVMKIKNISHLAEQWWQKGLWMELAVCPVSLYSAMSSVGICWTLILQLDVLPVNNSLTECAVCIKSQFYRSNC